MKKSMLLIFVLVAFGICAAVFFSTMKTNDTRAFISDRYEGVQLEQFNGNGDSMIPLIKSGSVVNIQRIPYESLQEGMVVIYKKDVFVYVCHALVKNTSNGWIAKGINNDFEDGVFVIESNYVGIVVK